MNVVKYGKWEISVDLEKTKEFYQNYVILRPYYHINILIGGASDEKLRVR